jgi:hypothetical protein
MEERDEFDEKRQELGTRKVRAGNSGVKRAIEEAEEDEEEEEE